MNTQQLFFIKMQNGHPDGRPLLLENLLQLGINPQNNSEWVEFVPQQPIRPSLRTKVVEQQYVVDGDKVLGTWVERDMTPEEIAILPPNPLLEMKGSAPDALQ